MRTMPISGSIGRIRSISAPGGSGRHEQSEPSFMIQVRLYVSVSSCPAPTPIVTGVRLSSACLIAATVRLTCSSSSQSIRPGACTCEALTLTRSPGMPSSVSTRLRSRGMKSSGLS